MFILVNLLSLRKCNRLSLKLSAYYFDCHRYLKYSSYFCSGYIKTTNYKKMDPILTGKTDIHRVIMIESIENGCQNLVDFERKLESSLNRWREDKLRGVRFVVAIPQVEWIPVLVKKGFKIHHALNEEIMLCLWLPEDEPNKIPDFAHYFIGAGAVVINDKQQILVVRERYRTIDYWKLPGGHVDRGEEVVEAAIREVLEETAIKTEFLSLVTIRWASKPQYPGCSDMYFVVRLKPVTTKITVEAEIEDSQWMDIDVYLNHPEVHENNKFFVRQAIQNEKDEIIMKQEHAFHPVTKGSQVLYAIYKNDDKTS